MVSADPVDSKIEPDFPLLLPVFIFILPPSKTSPLDVANTMLPDLAPEPAFTTIFPPPFPFEAPARKLTEPPTALLELPLENTNDPPSAMLAPLTNLISPLFLPNPVFNTTFPEIDFADDDFMEIIPLNPLEPTPLNTFTPPPVKVSLLPPIMLIVP